MVRRLTGSTFELVPSAEQLPYCLAFTHATNGVTRQLTMSASNQSFECPAEQPIGRRSFRVPVDEKAVKVIVLFTDQRINAASVSQQIVEAKAPEKLTAIDLRLPGAAHLVAIDFLPETDAEPTIGEVLGADAGTAP